MPRPPYFGDRTPKVVSHLQEISGFHEQHKLPMSLKYMAQSIRSLFHGTPPAPTKRKLNKKTGKMEIPPDPLRHIVFKLAKKHEIWFGKP